MAIAVLPGNRAWEAGALPRNDFYFFGGTRVLWLDTMGSRWPPAQRLPSHSQGESSLAVGGFTTGFTLALVWLRWLAPARAAG